MLSNKCSSVKPFFSAAVRFGPMKRVWAYVVEGDDIAEMDSVIDQIAELPGAIDIESKVARWID